jgi:hypothetical protein
MCLSALQSCVNAGFEELSASGGEKWQGYYGRARHASLTIKLQQVKDAALGVLEGPLDEVSALPICSVHGAGSLAKDPFRHLGVLLTMDLNYKPQLGATLTQLREAARAMKQCRASTGQKMRTLRTSLRPAVAHILSVSPFTPAELRQVDGFWPEWQNRRTAWPRACLMLLPMRTERRVDWDARP